LSPWLANQRPALVPDGRDIRFRDSSRVGAPCACAQEVQRAIRRLRSGEQTVDTILRTSGIMSVPPATSYEQQAKLAAEVAAVDAELADTATIRQTPTKILETR
jgi:hypothetical protein